MTRVPMLAPRVRTLSPRIAYAPKAVDPFYRSRAWRDLVARLILERGRRCECGCGQVGGIIVGDHRHELSDGGAPLDPNNVMLMRIECHNRKTAEARAERQRGR
jgi:5-methylcytosine-specific restriction enzyme A